MQFPRRADHYWRRLGGARMPPLVLAIAMVAAGCTAPGATPATPVTPTNEAVSPSVPALDREPAREAVLDAFGDVGAALIDLIPRRQEWVVDDLDDDSWRTLASGARARLKDAHDAVAGLDVADDRAVELYLTSLQLHRMALDVDIAATELTGALRRETQKLGARVRILGDRVFDAAQTRLDLLPQNVDLTDPVPDWEEFDLVPADPLAIPNRDATKGLPTEQDGRRELAEFSVSPRDVLSRLSDGEVTPSLAFAQHLEARESVVGELDLPADRSPDGIGVRLALLIHAEALRVAAVSMIEDAPDLGTAALARQMIELADHVDPLSAD